MMIQDYVQERDGNLYAGDSRVTVTSIASAYSILHQTPEEIHEDFPTLSLETIFGVLAYYLGHKDEVDREIDRQHALVEQMKQAQRDDPTSMYNVVRRRIEEAHKNEGQDEANPRR